MYFPTHFHCKHLLLPDNEEESSILQKLLYLIATWYVTALYDLNDHAYSLKVLEKCYLLLLGFLKSCLKNTRVYVFRLCMTNPLHRPRENLKNSSSNCSLDLIHCELLLFALNNYSENVNFFHVISLNIGKINFRCN